MGKDRLQRRGLGHLRPPVVDLRPLQRPHHRTGLQDLHHRGVLGERPHVVVGRVGEYLHRCADLHERPVVHDGDPVGQLQGLDEVVGDEHQRPAKPHLELDQLVLHVPADERVEGGERLVEEQHLGIDGQRPGQPHPLLHAAAELLGVMIAPALEADRLQELPGAVLPLAAVDPLHLQPVGHVVHHRAVREQPEVLEHHRHLPAPQVAQRGAVGPGELRAAHLHGSLGGLDQVGDAPDEGGLS